MTDDQFNFSGDGDQREDLTPGSDVESDLFGDVDPETDYQAESESWLGEPASTELAIETVDGVDVKRFVLEEPDSAATMEQLLVAVLQDDKYSFCEAMVSEPRITIDLWESQLTERERQLLFDLSFAWGRFGDFETMAQAADEVEQRLSETVSDE